MSDALKPCPFCGGTATLRTTGGWSGIGCETAKCPAHLHALTHRTPSAAIATWNHRATSAQEAQIAMLREALEAAHEALESIALAGMSGTGMESEEGMRDWHARRAWEFIGIAARSLDGPRAALAATGEQT